MHVELYKAMLKSHTHIGCNVSEIQNQKDEHQAFQDTAKVSDLKTQTLLLIYFQIIQGVINSQLNFKNSCWIEIV